MIRLFTGDALSVLRTLPDASVHACVNPAYVQIAAERLRSAGLEVEVGGEVVPELEGVAEQAPLLVG